MLLSFQSFSCCKCRIGSYILFVSSGMCVGSMWHSMWHMHDKTVGGDLQEFFWPVFLFLSGFLQSFLFL
jgi:hypothetical protein